MGCTSTRIEKGRTCKLEKTRPLPDSFPLKTPFEPMGILEYMEYMKHSRRFR